VHINGARYKAEGKTKNGKRIRFHEIKADRKQSAKYEHKDSIKVKQKNVGESRLQEVRDGQQTNKNPINPMLAFWWPVQLRLLFLTITLHRQLFLHRHYSVLHRHYSFSTATRPILFNLIFLTILIQSP